MFDIRVRMLKTISILLACYIKLILSSACKDTLQLCDFTVPKLPIYNAVKLSYSGMSQSECESRMKLFDWSVVMYCEESVLCGLGLDQSRDWRPFVSSAVEPVGEMCRVIVNVEEISCTQFKETLFHIGIMRELFWNCIGKGGQYCQLNRLRECTDVFGGFQCGDCLNGSVVDPQDDKNCKDAHAPTPQQSSTPDVNASLQQSGTPDVNASLQQSSNPDVNASLQQSSNPDVNASLQPAVFVNMQPAVTPVDGSYEWCEWDETNLITHLNTPRKLVKNMTRACYDQDSGHVVDSRKCPGRANKAYRVYLKGIREWDWTEALSKCIDKGGSVINGLNLTEDLAEEICRNQNNYKFWTSLLSHANSFKWTDYYEAKLTTDITTWDDDQPNKSDQEYRATFVFCGNHKLQDTVTIDQKLQVVCEYEANSQSIRFTPHF